MGVRENFLGIQSLELDHLQNRTLQGAIRAVVKSDPGVLPASQLSAVETYMESSHSAVALEPHHKVAALLVCLTQGSRDMEPDQQDLAAQMVYDIAEATDSHALVMDIQFGLYPVSR